MHKLRWPAPPGAFLATALAAVLAVALQGPSHAAGSAAPQIPLRETAERGWMPDVAGRVADLRARTERATAQARVRHLEETRGGQWWRAVAAAPVQPR